MKQLMTALLIIIFFINFPSLICAKRDISSDDFKLLYFQYDLGLFVYKPSIGSKLVFKREFVRGARWSEDGNKIEIILQIEKEGEKTIYELWGCSENGKDLEFIKPVGFNFAFHEFESLHLKKPKIYQSKKDGIYKTLPNGTQKKIVSFHGYYDYKLSRGYYDLRISKSGKYLIANKVGVDVPFISGPLLLLDIFLRFSKNYTYVFDVDGKEIVKIPNEKAYVTWKDFFEPE